MSKFKARFVANAGVKDIVGRGLIYDDNVAIIELVKNSKDANSESVEICFQHATDDASSETISELLICDYGKGMTQDDIIGKWLNIAYSEKKGSLKAYAGNKGVGRFSCDRLGEKLVLYTKSKKGKYIKLPIDWARFENRGKDEGISSIALTGQILTKAEFLKEINYENFDTGTILKIQRLRSIWSSKKLTKLINELAKFSPSLDNDFEVYLEAEEPFDKLEVTAKLKNRKINNNVLSKLSFKTTYIKTRIDKSGKFIFTDLYYQGEKIYSYQASNPYTTLKNISAEIHYLDTISKAYFTKNVGVGSTEYGSVFVFYNGFRISPYGNPKNDWLGLDQRKSQGTTRNLGTREIFGRIDINDKDNMFSVITSREGLAHNTAFYELAAYDDKEKATLSNNKEEYGFITVIIRQLEAFVVGGLNWNRLVDKLGSKNIVTLDDVAKNPERYKTRELSSQTVQDVLEKLLKSNFEVKKFELNKNLISQIQEKNELKFEAYKKEFLIKTQNKALAEISPTEKGALRKILENEAAKTDAAIEERDFAEIKAQEATNKLAIERETNKYLISSRGNLSPDAEGLIHTIKFTNSKIKTITSSLLEDLLSDEIDKDQLIKGLLRIKLHSDKALKMAVLATKADVDSDIESINIDLPTYVKEYLADFADDSEGELEFIFDSNKISCMKKVNVLALSVVLDNLISNSQKWGARTVRIEFEKKGKTLKILFSDDGQGVSKKFLSSPKSMFELGIKDKPPQPIALGGSGIGLFHVNNLLKEMTTTRASIKFLGNGNVLQGATFELEFK